MSRISNVLAHPVAVPRSERFRPKTAHGESELSQYVILELETDEGVVGLGEVTCAPRWNGEEPEGTVYLLLRVLAPLLEGCDPMNWVEVGAMVDSAVRDRPFLRAGIEMACLDIVGKSLGLPVSALLGGPSDGLRIASKGTLPARPAAETQAMAREMVKLGVGTLKVKVGLDLETDIDRVRAVRDVVGDDSLIVVDANEGWDMPQALEAARRLADLGVGAIEQPLPRSAGMLSAVLAQQSQIPLVGDESIWNAPDIVRSGTEGLFSAVSVYPGKCGGIRETLRLAFLAESLGLGVTFGSNMELGIASAALAHTIAAFSSVPLALPADLIGPLYHESALCEPPEFVNWGWTSVPVGVGLGVRLDRDALASFAMPVLGTSSRGVF